MIKIEKNYYNICRDCMMLGVRFFLYILKIHTRILEYKKDFYIKIL